MQKETINMSTEQFAELMNVSLAYLSKHNAKVIEKAEKEKGLIVKKEGRGKTAKYCLVPVEKEKGLFDFKNCELEFEKSFIRYQSIKFKILLMLMLKPDRTFFEGEIETLAKKIGMEIDEVKNNGHKSEKIKAVAAAIEELQKEEIIIVYYDEKQRRGNKMYMFIRPSAKEDTIPIQSDGILHAKKMCEENRINVEWQSFLKIWLSLKVFRMEERLSFTMSDIKEMSGVGVSATKKILSYMRQMDLIAVKRDVLYIKEHNMFINKGLKAEHASFDFDLL